VIDDHRADTTARLTGEARIARSGVTLVYDETGTLHLPGQATPLHATRRYLMARSGRELVVRFVDGRPFHRIDLTDATPTARHACDPDEYAVTYDFSNWPDWSTVWTVTGPRKDYTMTSQYRAAP